MLSPASARPDDGDLFLEDDSPDTAQRGVPEPAPWRILIVDDDVDVHVVTKFALSNTNFQGRRLSFLHAYSAGEAVTLLAGNSDIALILLDVIMETEDAGLRLARKIRDELRNTLVRIVLRTGQPGQALEHSIIVDYDISDFWCKADLTTRKLFTTVIASLRAYDTLCQATLQRDRLAAELDKALQVQAAIGQHALVLTLGPDGSIRDASDMLCRFAAQPREALLGADLRTVFGNLLPAALAYDIVAAVRRDGGWAGDIRVAAPDGTLLDLRCAVLAFSAPDGEPHQYVAVATPLDACP